MLRDSWRLKSATWNVEQLIFLNESAANEHTADPKYGWAPLGITLEAVSPLHRLER